MIYIDEKQIRIQLFQKILRVSDQCIMVAMKNKKIIIDGYKLCITYLEKTEIIIVGRFKSIQFLEIEENLC